MTLHVRVYYHLGFWRFLLFGDIKVKMFVNQEMTATDPHYDYTCKNYIHFDTHILPLSSNTQNHSKFYMLSLFLFPHSNSYFLQ